MSKLVKSFCLAMAVVVATSVSALAQECKDESVSATSREYVSRSLGAFPGSWAAWRKKVKAEHGDGWQAWRRAKDRKINCEQINNSEGKRRWVCTREGRPCGGKTQTADLPQCEGEAPRRMERFDKGCHIQQLQRALNDVQGCELEVDGNFGRGTRACVMEFQRGNGLKADGIVGPNTLDKLYG